MFIALYEFQVKPGREAEFRQTWLKTTIGIYRQYGSLGSRLHSTAEPGIYVGYAQWSSRSAWADEKPPFAEEFERAREAMRDCLLGSRTVYEMEVADDYLQQSPFA